MLLNSRSHRKILSRFLFLVIFSFGLPSFAKTSCELQILAHLSLPAGQERDFTEVIEPHYARAKAKVRHLEQFAGYIRSPFYGVLLGKALHNLTGNRDAQELLELNHDEIVVEMLAVLKGAFLEDQGITRWHLYENVSSEVLKAMNSQGLSDANTGSAIQRARNFIVREKKNLAAEFLLPRPRIKSFKRMATLVTSLTKKGDDEDLLKEILKANLDIYIELVHQQWRMSAYVAASGVLSQINFTGDFALPRLPMGLPSIRGLSFKSRVRQFARDIREIEKSFQGSHRIESLVQSLIYSLALGTVNDEFEERFAETRANFRDISSRDQSYGERLVDLNIYALNLSILALQMRELRSVIMYLASRMGNSDVRSVALQRIEEIELSLKFEWEQDLSLLMKELEFLEEDISDLRSDMAAAKYAVAIEEIHKILSGFAI